MSSPITPANSANLTGTSSAKSMRIEGEAEIGTYRLPKGSSPEQGPALKEHGVSFFFLLSCLSFLLGTGAAIPYSRFHEIGLKGRSGEIVPSSVRSSYVCQLDDALAVCEEGVMG